MKTVPINTPVMAPRGLKAWEKLRRRTALSGSPIWAISGLDPVSRKSETAGDDEQREQEQ